MPSVGTPPQAQPDVTKQIASLMTSPAMGNAGVVGYGAMPMAQPAEKVAPEPSPMTSPSVGAAPTIADRGLLPQIGAVKGMPGVPEMAQPGQPGQQPVRVDGRVPVVAAIKCWPNIGRCLGISGLAQCLIIVVRSWFGSTFQ